jgi:uncharacterized repeat protein (TIGR03803 family)
MRWPRLWVRCGFIGLSALLPATPAQAQVETVWHSFSGFPTDGKAPAGSLLQSGSSFFGMTSAGGLNGEGTIFQIATTGGGYNVTYSFNGAPNDGGAPTGSLIQLGSNFYGMTVAGGSGNGGSVFQTSINGVGSNLQHSFTGGATDGSSPHGSLLQIGSTVYGITNTGGTAGGGVIFKQNADGTNYTIIHTFLGGPADGSAPFGSLVQSGGTLYGMTAGGGSAGFGTIFKFNADGSGFSLVHSFTIGAGGNTPSGSLTLSGATLYGMTGAGGSANLGTIFKIGTDGTGFTVLHSFAGGASDGGNPEGSLLLSGTTLYGMAAIGGSANLGTILGIQTDGTGYGVIYSFLGGAGDGAGPEGDLLLSGTSLYGLTAGGGVSNDGVIFSVAIPEPSSLSLVGVGGLSAIFARWQRSHKA